MKKLLMYALLLGAMPVNMMAQDDDMYFVPTKENVAKEAKSYGMPSKTYYSGSSRSTDEYNRRFGSSVTPVDSMGNDIIDFSAVRGVYPDSVYADGEDTDYTYTRRMSRFDDYTPSQAYWDGYQAGRWSSPWYSSYYSWYDRWWWDDPWYYSGYYYPYYGWYSPWHYSSWYSPWHYGYYGYHGWYGRPYYGGCWYGGRSYRTTPTQYRHQVRSVSGRRFGESATGSRSSGSTRSFGSSSRNSSPSFGGSNNSSFGGSSSGGSRSFGSGGGSSRSSSGGGGRSFGGRR